MTNAETRWHEAQTRLWNAEGNRDVERAAEEDMRAAVSDWHHERG